MSAALPASEEITSSTELASAPETFSRTRTAKRAPGDTLLTLCFLSLFFVQLVHHQLWRDELNAWGLAVSSSTLPTLVHYVHYEGHPLLWYLLLWFLSRFTSDPIVLKFVEGSVAIAIYLVVGLCSPFSRIEKALLFFGYFISFEYTVMARMYGLCLLTALIYLRRRSLHPDSYIGNAITLGILANTDSLGVMLSVAFGAEYVWSQTGELGRTAFFRQKAVKAIAAYVILLSFSTWSGYPSPDVSRRASDPFGLYAFQLGHLLVAVYQVIVGPWLPIQPGFPHHFWHPVVQPEQIVLAPIVLLVYYKLFKRQTNLLILIGITVVESVAFNHLVYPGRTRHFGITFIAFLAALWLQRCGRPAVPVLGRIMLGLSAAAGILAAGVQWHHPFSNAGTAAAWLRAHDLEHAALVGTLDTSVAAVAEELQRPIYFLDCNCSNGFLLFSKQRDAFRWDQIPDRLVLASRPCRLLK